MQSRNRMASEHAIRNHWAAQVSRLPTFDSEAEVLETGVCFACGVLNKKCERAHIQPLCQGGTNLADNLHMLCGYCHKASEGMSGAEYWAWLQSRTVMDVLIQRMAVNGANIWSGLMLASLDKAADSA